MTAKKEPLTWKPGWNGKPYKGDDWTVANSMIPSRPLIKAEREKHNKAMIEWAKKSGKNVKVTKDARGNVTISVGGK